MYYWNPQKLKELKAAGYKLHSCQEAKATSSKRQASSTKGPGLERQAPSCKRQAPSEYKKSRQFSSPKQNGSRSRPVACSAKIPEPGYN